MVPTLGVADRLDIVSVRADDEGGVVVGVVARAQARRAVVLPAGGKGRLVEGIHLLAGRGREGDMQVCRLLLRLEQAEGDGVVRAQLDAIGRRAFPDDHDTKRRKRLKEEGLACGKVADTELDVIEHAVSLGRATGWPG